MARSPLARRLRELAADHATAARLGLPADEYTELRDEAAADLDGPSRRQLLGRAAALGLAVAAGGLAAARPARAADPRATALPSPRPTARATGEAPRIAVIGAGISGLNAALTLADKGVAATVYEANPSRIGGRMFSGGSPWHPGLWEQGQVSEYGGELLDTGHHTMLQLCQRFGLGTTSVRHVYGAQADQVLWFQGGYYPRAQADLDFKPVWQAIRSDIQAGGSAPTWDSHNAAAVALDGMTVRDWINSRVPGGCASLLGAFLDVAYNVEYGADTTAQSSYDLLTLLSSQANPGSFNIWGGSDERYHITGGNDQVPHAIAAALPAGTVQQGWTLTAVTRNADGTQTLAFDLDGGGTRTVTADHTILAVPLPVLQQDIDLSGAGLDAMMRGVLTHMTMGACTKLNMQFGSRPWAGSGPWPGISNGECFSDQDFQQAWDVTRGQAGSDGILVQYGGGSLARSLTPPTAFTDASTPYTAALVTRYLAQIERLFPGTGAAWNGRATLSAWHLNPYSHGAYSYWPTGYLTSYAGYEGTAQGNLHFAGEHTSYNFQGYMEGGAQEGARAAQEVLTAIGA
ncbi:monoamine oxidase [Kitasatospora sp. GP30]|uniref:flavin monoamine oxidase family protein n=1 Tax=Kitasatospora sp. GP30 TaxID=3035084 RepID=UPI000C701649|nr:NAD(P)/FAD-dependent oxidoreductase [Kitasatospora sp. GP30]MDH6138748.1 monoamine oxidase [Kitasatospora sp. GP30]